MRNAHILGTLLLLLYINRGVTQRPNIVLVLADDLGWYDVGYHGSEVQTPNIDRLAREGVTLDSYYTQPMCGPSRLQLLTGRYQIRYGMQHLNLLPGQPHGMPLDLPTVASELREAGYSTHAVGKWHLGYHTPDHLPTARGFDSFYGMLNGQGHYYRHCRKKGKTCYRDLRNNTEVDWSEDSNIHGGYLYTEKAERVLRRHAERPDPNKPMFLYLSHQLVHDPGQVPQMYKDMYSTIRNKARRNHAAQTSMLDDSIGNITETLRETGLWNNTVLIFSTDNGGITSRGGYNTPLRGRKKELWEGGIRGAAFVHSPLLLPARQGVMVRDLLHITDWFPTLLALAGRSYDGLGLDGHNMWPIISDGAVGTRQEILHGLDPLWKKVGRMHTDSPFDSRIRAAIRVGEWKLLTGDPGKGFWYDPARPRNAEKQPEPKMKNLWLFNVVSDPKERNDVAASHPDVVHRLLTRLAHYNASAAPCSYPAVDRQSHPKHLGDAWGPWLEN